MRRCLLCFVAILATACAGSDAPAGTVLRVANWVPLEHPLLTEVIRPWADEVARVTDGRVTMQIVETPLGPPPAQFDLAANGVVDVAFGVHNYTPGRFTATLLAELPFQCDRSEYLSVAWWRVHQQYIEGVNEHRGTKLLAVFTHGPGQLWARGRDLRSTGSIRGSKIRVAGGFAQEVANALGFVPLQAPVTDAYQLLSAGVADGIQSPSESITSFRLENVLDQGLLVPGGLYSVSFFVVMNEAKWLSLSSEDRDAITAISGEALARRAGEAWDRADQAALAAVAEHGRVTLITPDEAQMAFFRQALEPYTARTLERIADRGVDAQAAYDALQSAIADVKAGR